MTYHKGNEHMGEPVGFAKNLTKSKAVVYTAYRNDPIKSEALAFPGIRPRASKSPVGLDQHARPTASGREVASAQGTLSRARPSA